MFKLFRAGVLAAFAGAVAALPLAAHADTTKVGAINVCYYVTNCPFVGLADGPVFQVQNLSRSVMRGVFFKILKNTALGVVADSYFVGTLKPAASAVIEPGLSDDRRKHPSGGFFTPQGALTDTSDQGPNADAVAFLLVGNIGGLPISSGVIKAGASKGPSNDGTVKLLNFLGGPGNADGPCSECFGPKQIAVIIETPPPASPLEIGLQH